jgi:hypothetical protein
MGVGRKRRKDRRGIQLLATFALAVIGGSAVGALAWRAVVHDDATAGNSLALTVVSVVSGLLVLAGAKGRQSDDISSDQEDDPGSESPQ